MSDDFQEAWEAADRELEVLLAREIEGPLCPHELVRKSILLRLSKRGSSCQDVLAPLNLALSLDPECVGAHLEMGWTLFVMEDDAASARTAFQRAADILRELNAEVVKGFEACDSEANPRPREPAGTA
jgi:hypothetical protein